MQLTKSIEQLSSLNLKDANIELQPVGMSMASESLSDSKKSEVQSSQQVKKLLEKLRKKEQVEIELTQSIEQLSEKLELSRAAVTTPPTLSLNLKDTNIELQPVGMSMASESLSDSKKSAVKESEQVKKLLEKLRKKEQVEIELTLSIEHLSEQLKLSRAATIPATLSLNLKDGNIELRPLGMSMASKSLSQMIQVKSRQGRKSIISTSLAEISVDPQPPRRKVSMISTSLAEMTVDPKPVSSEFLKSKIVLAENASVLIEDLRRKLREVQSY